MKRNEKFDNGRRYAIDDGAADWSTAEAQVARLAASAGKGEGKATLVSVKTTGGAAKAGAKRKAEEAGHGDGERDGKGADKKLKSRWSMKKGGKR